MDTLRQRPLVEVLMIRDNLPRDEVIRMVKESASTIFTENADPEEILANDFGLEPDWVMDLLEYAI